MRSEYKNCTIFIGIDQSLNSTGYYIHELNTSPDSDIKGLIKPGPRRGAKRLAYIFNTLTALLVEYGAEDIFVCMEGYAYNASAGKIFELGEVGGIVKLACEMRGIICMSVPPTELKKFVTGKGSASKNQMMEITGEKQNDIADACGLSQVAKEICLRESTERKKLEVVSNCLKNYREDKVKKKYTRPKGKKQEEQFRL